MLKVTARISYMSKDMFTVYWKELSNCNNIWLYIGSVGRKATCSTTSEDLISFNNWGHLFKTGKTNVFVVE